MPGRAKDIGVGAEGSMWVIGTNKEGGGFGIYRMKPDRRGYKKIAGSALKVSVDKSGNGWVVNNGNKIFKHNGSRWEVQSGRARDIGCGSEGTMWVIGTNKVGRGGWGIYRMNTGPQITMWATNTQKNFSWKENIQYALVV